METILWRRVDAPGHDGCRFAKKKGGWRLEGATAFLLDGIPSCLAYRVECDAEWRTEHGEVHGWVGTRPIDYLVDRSPDGRWTLNGDVMPHVQGCIDLDFGFTPATNLFQLQRVALKVGEATDLQVAWLDAGSGALQLLEQRYERRTADSYFYSAPRFEYEATLAVNKAGFVTTYPDLWEAVS